MKAIMFIASGTEDSEFIVTRDLLMRASIEVVTISIENKNVCLSHHLECVADKTIDEINEEILCDCVILPGGKIGVDKFRKCEKLKRIILNNYNNNKLVCAICAAPVVLSDIGILNNKEYTVYEGFQKEISTGIYKKVGVVENENIITSRSMFYSIDFGLKIIRRLLGEEIELKVSKGILKVE